MGVDKAKLLSGPSETTVALDLGFGIIFQTEFLVRFLADIIIISIHGIYIAMSLITKYYRRKPLVDDSKSALSRDIHKDSILK